MEGERIERRELLEKEREKERKRKGETLLVTHLFSSSFVQQHIKKGGNDEKRKKGIKPERERVREREREGESQREEQVNR